MPYQCLNHPALHWQNYSDVREFSDDVSQPQEPRFDHRVTQDAITKKYRTTSNTVPSGCSFVGCRITASCKFGQTRCPQVALLILPSAWAVNQLFVNTLVAFVNTQLCVGLWFRCDRARSKLSTTGSNSVIVLRFTCCSESSFFGCACGNFRNPLQSACIDYYALPTGL